MACAPARVAWTDAICHGAKAPENVGLIEVEVSFCGSAETRPDNINNKILHPAL